MEKDSLFKLLYEKIPQMKEEKFFEEGIWCYYSPAVTYDLPDYGFKIHISATTVNVLDIAELIFPTLIEKNIRFKFVKSLAHLGLLNMGNYGYSQIGKMCTIYPENESDLLYLLDICYKKTKKFNSISIPSDYQYRCSNVVYYRYGELKISKANEDKIGFVDKRKRIIPDNIKVPVEDYYIPRLGSVTGKYTPIKCLRVRGKSSVFLAIDISRKYMCVIKSGNYLGEIDSYGEDGLDKVYNEYNNLKNLKELKIFPDIYDVFYEGNALFIVEEYLAGETLTDIFLSEKECNPSVLFNVLKCLKSIHKAGYIVNDLSPDNIVINDKKVVRFIDAEYCVLENKYSNKMNSIGTPGFAKSKYGLKDKDLYAFICLCYFFFNRNNYRILREQTKQDFIKKIDEDPHFLENIDININEVLGMETEHFFQQAYEAKIQVLEQLIKKHE